MMTNLYDVINDIVPIVENTYDQKKVSVHADSLVGDVHYGAVVILDMQKNKLLQHNAANQQVGKIFAHVVSPTALTVLQSACMSDLSSGISIENNNGVFTFNGVLLLINPYLDDVAPIKTVHMTLDGNMTVGSLALKNIAFI